MAKKEQKQKHMNMIFHVVGSVPGSALKVSTKQVQWIWRQTLGIRKLESSKLNDLRILGPSKSNMKISSPTEPERNMPVCLIQTGDKGAEGKGTMRCGLKGGDTVTDCPPLPIQLERFLNRLPTYLSQDYHQPNQDF